MWARSYADVSCYFVNVGIAIALTDGLVAPGVPDTDMKSLSQIARESKSLVERARTNKLLALNTALPPLM